ncbi:MAG: class I SAM-dependent methyltransferase [Deltaproteobacteria bacterium]|nr:class I SAM-dependent methyltransferase [Deltaproteobacteria bacterium]MBI3388218.1 class I SAM-dependent methyltransferase [Deltaproteobacteria bacterium]
MNERQQRFVFDDVAELYARRRPSYPSQLVDDLIAIAGLRAGSRLLEIGCGPGTASALLAGRGFELLCLEPGPRLADLARRRLQDDPHAVVVTTTFEEWSVEAEVFDLVYAAQSFHWIDASVRLVKSAQALKPGGTLAIFGNRPLPGAAEVDADIQKAYAKHAPPLATRGDLSNTRENFAAMLEQSPLFQPAQWREYPWYIEYTAEAYVELLQTHSDHQMLPVAQRTQLLEAIGAAIIRHGGRLAIDHVTVLCWAQRK